MSISNTTLSGGHSVLKYTCRLLLLVQVALLLALNAFTIRPVYAQEDSCLLIIASETSVADAKEFITESGTVSERAIHKAKNGYFAITAGMLPRASASQAIAALVARGEIPNDAFCRLASAYELIETVPPPVQGMGITKRMDASLEWALDLWSNTSKFWLFGALLVFFGALIGLLLRRQGAKSAPQKTKNPSVALGAAAVAHLKPKATAQPSKLLAAIGRGVVALLAVLCAGAFIIVFWKHEIPRHFDAYWLGIGLVGLFVSVISYTILRGKYIMRVPALVLVGGATAALAAFSGVSPRMNERMVLLAGQLGVPDTLVAQAETALPDWPDQTEQSVVDVIMNAPAAPANDSFRPEITAQSLASQRAHLGELAAQTQSIRAQTITDARAQTDRLCSQYAGQARTLGVSVQGLGMIDTNRERLTDFVNCSHGAIEKIVLVAEIMYNRQAERYQLIAQSLSIPTQDYQLRPIKLEQLYQPLLNEIIVPEVARFETYAANTYRELNVYTQTRQEDLRRQRSAILNLTRRTAQMQEAEARAQWQRDNPNLRLMTPEEMRQYVAQYEAGLLYPDDVGKDANPEAVDAASLEADNSETERLEAERPEANDRSLEGKSATSSGKEQESQNADVGTDTATESAGTPESSNADVGTGTATNSAGTPESDTPRSGGGTLTLTVSESEDCSPPANYSSSCTENIARRDREIEAEKKRMAEFVAENARIEAERKRKVAEDARKERERLALSKKCNALFEAKIAQCNKPGDYACGEKVEGDRRVCFGKPRERGPSYVITQ